MGSPDSVVRINNTIFQQTQQQWFDVLTTRQPSPADLTDELRHDIQGIINKLSSDTVFIDPRFCYTWPVWRPLIANTHDDVFFVVPYHAPREYVAILNYEDGIPLDAAYLLWSSYMLEAERHSRNAPRFMIDHADVLRNWETACAPLITHLHHQLTPNDTQAAINTFMREYSSVGHTPSHESLDTTPAAVFAERVYHALTHHADPTIFDQLHDEFVHTIIPSMDLVQYRQFVTAQTARMHTSEAYIQQLHTHHQHEVQALHDDYKTQLDEMYSHLNENAAAIHEKLTLRIHELHDFYAEKLKEVDNSEHQGTRQLTAKLEQTNKIVQQRTQHIQDLKFALEKQKSAHDTQMTTISNNIATERAYYQQTIDNLTKQVAWQQQTINEQRDQLHLARFIMPIIVWVHRIRKTLRRT
jgi:hypothetical protein